MSSEAKKSERKPLDAQFVGETNAAAIKALGDNTARRKWPDSKRGSPLTTNILCAEIARLNIAREALVSALTELVEACDEPALDNPKDPAYPDALNRQSRALQDAATTLASQVRRAA